LLVHVVDITHNDAAEQFQTVLEILAELGLADKPQLTVLNKMDKVAGNQEEMNGLALATVVKPPDENTLAISALKGWGLDRLLDRIAAHLSRNFDADSTQNRVD
jgi:GTP-binding protein HflX